MSFHWHAQTEASSVLSKALNCSSTVILDSEVVCLMPVKDHIASHSFLLTQKIWPSLFVSALAPTLYSACSQFSGINSNKVKVFESSTSRDWSGLMGVSTQHGWLNFVPLCSLSENTKRRNIFTVGRFGEMMNLTLSCVVSETMPLFSVFSVLY